MQMPLQDGILLINHAFEMVEEEKMFNRWIQQAQYVMSFQEFKQSLTNPKFKPEKEVLNEVDTILQTMAGGVESGNI